MNNTELIDLIFERLAYYATSGKPFTAFDITKHLRSSGRTVDASRVSELVREIYLGDQVDINRERMVLSNGDTAYVYFTVGVDPYDHYMVSRDDDANEDVSNPEEDSHTLQACCGGSCGCSSKGAVDSSKEFTVKFVPISGDKGYELFFINIDGTQSSVGCIENINDFYGLFTGSNTTNTANTANTANNTSDSTNSVPNSTETEVADAKGRVFIRKNIVQSLGGIHSGFVYVKKGSDFINFYSSGNAPENHSIYVVDVYGNAKIGGFKPMSSVKLNIFS